MHKFWLKIGRLGEPLTRVQIDFGHGTAEVWVEGIESVSLSDWKRSRATVGNYEVELVPGRVCVSVGIVSTRDRLHIFPWSCRTEGRMHYAFCPPGWESLGMSPEELVAAQAAIDEFCEARKSRPMRQAA